MEISSLVKSELAATCGSLGRLNAEGKYVVDPQCFESVRDLIRFLRRDDAHHEVRMFLGGSKVLQSDLVPIATVSVDNSDLFDITVRLLVNLTSPVILLYKDETPVEKIGRNYYMRLIQYSQEYKTAFCNVEFWKAVMAKLSQLFEVDWSERSEDSSLQIERLLVLLRNVLQVPSDSAQEQRPDNDITVHDKVLWALRESQVMELLLYVASNNEEQKYFLHLLEIFSLVLREQNPQSLAQCDVTNSASEKNREAQELSDLRQKEKYNSKSFKNTRSFAQTFVLKNVKTISNNDAVYHKSLDKMNELKLTQDSKRVKTPKNRFPEDSERVERRSTFSIRLFLKEFCLELLSCGFNRLMVIVKDKLVSGKALANDESYYFWALKFFLEFAANANIDVSLISECVNVHTFHFVQTQIENCYDHLTTDKKKVSTWVRRLHLNIKAYKSLLQTLIWMDSSSDQKARDMSKVLKSNLFYVPEYRDLVVTCLLRYDSGKFPLSFLRDLIETNHIYLKLLENYCKQNKIVVKRNKRVVKKRSKKKATVEPPPAETPADKWEKINDEVLKIIELNTEIPVVVPFDGASDVPIDEQKEDAMKNIQKKLRSGDLINAIGLLRSSRQVWPENNDFGCPNMSHEDEVMALQEICMADLGVEYEESRPPVEEHFENDSGDGDDSEEEQTEVSENNYDVEDYVKRLVNKKVVESACLLFGNYKRNTPNTNHCVLKLLHRIGWQCKAPAMMYQASFFVTLNKIMQEKNSAYKEMQQFGKQLIKKFREHAKLNPKIFMELLFWKEPKIAIDIEEGYGTSESKETKGKWSEEEEDEMRRLWVEFDNKMLEGDKVNWIKDNLINQDRSRIAIINKLKNLMLLPPGPMRGEKRKPLDWPEDDTKLLVELFEQFKDALDVAEMIRIRMMSRSKKSIKDKIVQLGLVQSLTELRKKRTVKSGKSNAVSGVVSPRNSSGYEESDHSDHSGHEENYIFSRAEAITSLKEIESMKLGLAWVKDTLTEALEDDDYSFSSDGFPLLPLDKHHAEALENSNFLEALRKLNFTEPNDSQIYWKLRGNRNEMKLALEVVDAAINGNIGEMSTENKSQNGRRIVSDDSDSEDEFEKLRRVLPKATENGNRNNSEITTINATKSPSKKSHMINEVGSDSEKSEQLDKPSSQSHALDSDRSDKGEASADDFTPVEKPSKPKQTRKTPSRRAGHLGSDDSDTGSDHGPSKTNGNTRRGPVASDSEGEVVTPNEYWRMKRRRCIGSDSEVEGEASGEEMRDAPREVRKKSRLLDSDSEVEGHGSMEDIDKAK